MKASVCLLLILCLFAGLSVLIQLQAYLQEKRRAKKDSLTKEDVEDVLRKVYHDKQHGKLRE